MIDIFDHQLEAKPSDRSGDVSEHRRNPRERFHRPITWTENVNFVHDQRLQVGQSADEVRDSY